MSTWCYIGSWEGKNVILMYFADGEGGSTLVAACVYFEDQKDLMSPLTSGKGVIQVSWFGCW